MQLTTTSVLVVDDDESDALLAELALRSSLPSVTLVHAPSGPAALERLMDERFDVVLLDLSMPEMGGFEVLDELARRGPVPPVVILTSSTQARDREEAARRHLPYVVKDSDFDAFADSLVDVVSSF